LLIRNHFNYLDAVINIWPQSHDVRTAPADGRFFVLPLSRTVKAGVEN
jgi:hypothetical protein